MALMIRFQSAVGKLGPSLKEGRALPVLGESSDGFKMSNIAKKAGRKREPMPSLKKEHTMPEGFLIPAAFKRCK